MLLVVAVLLIRDLVFLNQFLEPLEFSFFPSVKSLHWLLSLCCCCSSSSSRWWIAYVVVLRLFYLLRQLCFDHLEGSVLALLEYALENVELWTLSCMASHEDENMR